MTTIIEYYKMKAVTGYASKHGVLDGLPLPDQLVGLELEIEGFNPEFEQVFGGCTFTADGSLRNYDGGLGIEAITKPIATKHVPHLLRAFMDKFKIDDENYSERCSTHVHFNVQQLNWDQLTTICLLYQTMERLLFRFVGHNRGDSIFCVPWNQSSLSYSIVDALQSGSGENVFRRWQKYSALNLIPVMDKGTVEFRHLHGTCDVELITQWIGIISCMFKYASEKPLQSVKDEIMNMNTVSNYREWLTQVFGKYVDVLQGEHTEVDLATGVIDSKLMLIQPKKINLDSALRNETATRPISRAIPRGDGNFVYYNNPTEPPWGVAVPATDAPETAAQTLNRLTRTVATDQQMMQAFAAQARYNAPRAESPFEEEAPF